MHFLKIIILAIILSFILIDSRLSNAKETEEASATLPLKEILRLYKEKDATDNIPKIKTPYKGILNKLELSGRLRDYSITITANTTVTILSENEWVVIPLIKKDKSIKITNIQNLDSGFFITDKGYFSFVSKTQGSYNFSFSFIKNVTEGNLKKQVEISLSKTTYAIFKLQFDEGLFTILSNATEEDNGIIIYPNNNKFYIAWQSNHSNIKKQRVKKHKYVPVESIIIAAHGSIVATLEGRQIARYLYKLRFSGNKIISFNIPNKHKLEKVYLNSVAIPFKLINNQLNLDVSHAQVGDEAATLELVITNNIGNFLLSGNLEPKIPSASWNINEQYLVLNLPYVFNYKWSSGSLSPINEIPEVKYSYNIPIPGKTMYFHQHLIASLSPHLNIDYTIDLEGKYFH